MEFHILGAVGFTHYMTGQFRDDLHSQSLDWYRQN